MTAHLLPPAASMPTTTLPADQIAKTWKAAQDFEAMALGQLLQPIFDTVDMSNNPFGGGAAEGAFRPMLVNEMAKHMAQEGGLGLAAPVFAQMLRAQEARTGEQTIMPASAGDSPAMDTAR